MGEGFFFPSHGRRLYGFLERPPTGVTVRDEAALVIHPFMEERQDAHPILRALAQRLASRGHPTLRFDLYGHGDSEGEWQDATIAAWLEDITAASEVLRQQTGATRLGLYGLRFGGTLAALAARALAPDHLVLWQPIVRGEQYVMDLLRAHLSAEMVLHKRAGISRDVLVERLRSGQNINLFGYLFSPAQFQGISPIDLTVDLNGYTGRTLLVDVVRTLTARENPELRALAASLGEHGTLTRAVETQSLFAEGKVHYTRAEHAVSETLSWLEAG